MTAAEEQNYSTADYALDKNGEGKLLEDLHCIF